MSYRHVFAYGFSVFAKAAAAARFAGVACGVRFRVCFRTRFRIRCAVLSVVLSVAMLTIPSVSGAAPTALMEPADGTVATELRTPVTNGVVRLRWPASTLAPATAASWVTVTSSNGLVLPHAFVVAPQDRGHALRPMWLLVQVQGSPPYTLTVGPGAGSRPSGIEPNDKPDIRPGGVPSGIGDPLSTMPLAVIRAADWGAVTAVMADAQQRDDARESTWRAAALGIAALCVGALAAAIALFIKLQGTRGGTPKV